jgi:NAD(P)-dependent dehydrogenase (short-subunit alcohol dehydrogenase family)
MYNPYSLENKTILVTGASSGIGRATAIECSKLGATVIVTARNEDRLKETIEALEGKERAHCLIVADLTQEEEIERLVTLMPVLDGCVNNAGIGKILPVQFFSAEELEKIYLINCFAPMLLIKQLLKKKKLKNSSSIVFTSSIAGNLNISPGNGIYGTSKCAVNGFMKYAALELAGKGIRCNAVNPGIINTQLIENKLFSESDRARDIEKYPLKRYGEPAEVAFAIIYLLSDAASWITGTSIVIDGGRTLK